MSKRTADRLAALEALLAPQPDRWAELARKSFPVPMTVEMLDGHDAYVARCRAQHVAAGHIINADARPNFYCDTPEQWETYAMAQQARLIADAQADIDRCEALAAERRREADPIPPPARERRPQPTPFIPSTFGARV